MLAVSPSRSHPLEGLAAAVDALIQEDVAGRSTADLGEDLVGLRREIDRLEADFVRRLTRFEQERGYIADGAPNAISWLRSRCKLTAGGAVGRTEVARELPVLPDLDRLFREGAIGLDHALVLARTVTEVGPQSAAAAEPELVEAAQSLDPTQLRLVGRQLRFVVDPEGAAASAARNHERRFVRFSQTMDGVFALDGLLDAEGGATLKTALVALCAPVSGDPRTPGQRRADALVELASRQLQTGDLPRRGGQRPHLVLTVSTEALAGTPGAGAADLDGAGPVPASVAERIACDAALSVVTVGGQGEPLSVGRTRRTVPAPIRRALLVRDRTCRYPGCDRPAWWADAHHLEPWQRGGPTSLANLALFCRFHHTWIHERGMVVELTADGRIDVRRE